MSQVCPVWVGYLLASPVRKLFQNPDVILKSFVRDGMTVMDVGCAMGFFSLPAARLTGDSGKVVCIDCQEPMLTRLTKRAKKAGVMHRIETRMCTTDNLRADDLSTKVDVALAIAMVHEASNPAHLIKQISNTVKPGGVFYVAEPLGHVSLPQVEETRATIEQNGFEVLETQKSHRLYSMLLKKTA
ncbi:MAG: methyltransferase domain-containing protein [Deltaproteobacteria bacterium]|nr:methyltransferase domain-containing protein [Deltaproteobacteria bacterium]